MTKETYFEMYIDKKTIERLNFLANLLEKKNDGNDSYKFYRESAKKIQEYLYLPLSKKNSIPKLTPKHLYEMIKLENKVTLPF